MIGVFFSFCFGFFIIRYQTSLLLGRGSDHAVHLFLVRALRGNRGKLPVQIPGIINPSYCGAMPLYLHWVLSRFPDATQRWVEQNLAAAVMVCQLLSITGFLLINNAKDYLIGLSCVLTVLTPYTYHAFSARNYGLSSRGIGLALFTVLGLVDVFIFSSNHGDYVMVGWVVVVFLSFLIWCFNTFAQQIFIINGLIHLCFGRAQLIISLIVGLILFIIVHRQYAVSYLYHTCRFIYNYATEVADRFILQRRPSIWGDWIKDIWVSFRGSKLKALSYIYSNSLFIMVFLMPAVLVSSWLTIHSYKPNAEFSNYQICGLYSMSGLIAGVMITFRRTRFLGEPERYLEAVVPFASIYLANHLIESAVNDKIIVLLCIILGAVCVGQIFVIKMQTPHVEKALNEIYEIESAIKSKMDSNSISLCCNNEEVTKMLMRNPWKFFRLWAAGQSYAGMSFGQAVDVYPYLTADCFQKVIIEYKATVAIIDVRSNADLPDVKGCYPIQMAKTDTFRVYKIEWNE